MAAVTGAVGTLGRGPSPARLLAWHPEWWVYAVAAVAWLDLVLMSKLSTDGAVPAGHHDHGAAAVSEPLLSSWAESWSHWVLMVAAMMLPVVAPQVRNVAMRSLWLRRQRSAGLFVVGYVAVWVAVGAVVLTPLVALDLHPLGTPWLVGILIVAAAWQVSPPRRRILRRCASLRLGPAAGRSADLDCAKAGVRSGRRCLATCGPLMLAMVASHSLLLMAGLLVVLLTERARGANPMRRGGRPQEAWVLLGFATATAAVAAWPALI